MAAVIRRKSEHRTDFELYSILEYYFDNESDEFKIEIDGVALYTSAEVLLLMIDRYSDYVYSVSDIFADTAGSYLIAQWKKYIARMGTNLLRAYNALYASYDPISNYDMVEQAADGDRKDKNTRESEPTGTTTVTVQNSAAGVDSVGAGANTDHSEQTTSYDNAKLTDTETPTNTMTMDFDGSTHTGYHEAREHYLKRSGNIGVTTSQQMIQSEIELRRVDLLSDFLTGFARQVFYYVG